MYCLLQKYDVLVLNILLKKNISMYQRSSDHCKGRIRTNRSKVRSFLIRPDGLRCFFLPFEIGFCSLRNVAEISTDALLGFSYPLSSSRRFALIYTSPLMASGVLFLHPSAVQWVVGVLYK